MGNQIKFISFYLIFVIITIIFTNCNFVRDSVLSGKEELSSVLLMMSRPVTIGAETVAQEAINSGTMHCTSANNGDFAEILSEAIELRPDEPQIVLGGNPTDICVYKILVSDPGIMDIEVTSYGGVSATAMIGALNYIPQNPFDNEQFSRFEDYGDTRRTIDVPFYNSGDSRYISILFLHPWLIDPNATPCQNGDCGFSITAVSRNEKPANCSRDFRWSLQNAVTVTPGENINSGGASWSDVCVYKNYSDRTIEYNIEVGAEPDTDVGLNAGALNHEPVSYSDSIKQVDQKSGNNGLGQNESLRNLVIDEGAYRYIWVRTLGNCNRDNCSFDFRIDPDTSPNCVSADIMLA